MKRHSINLTSEEQKMLEQILSHLRLPNLESLVKLCIRQRWIAIR